MKRDILEELRIDVTIQAMLGFCNTDTCSCHDCCRVKAISIKYSECVYVALVIQHEMRMLSTILLPVACLALPYSSNNRPLLRQISVFLLYVCKVYI